MQKTKREEVTKSLKGPVLSIMLQAPVFLFWFVHKQGFYCSEAREAQWTILGLKW